MSIKDVEVVHWYTPNDKQLRSLWIWASRPCKASHRRSQRRNHPAERCKSVRLDQLQSSLLGNRHDHDWCILWAYRILRLSLIGLSFPWILFRKTKENKGSQRKTIESTQPQTKGNRRKPKEPNKIKGNQRIPKEEWDNPRRTDFSCS